MNELTDLQICKRIAEIEGIYCHISENKKHVMVRDKSITWLIKFVNYNPLTSDSLCFKLMIKYDMPPMKVHSLKLYDCVFSEDVIEISRGAGIVSDKSPNKAICLAIIEAHKDESWRELTKNSTTR